MILGQLNDDDELLLAADRLGQRAEHGPGVLAHWAEPGLLVGPGALPHRDLPQEVLKGHAPRPGVAGAMPCRSSGSSWDMRSSTWPAAIRSARVSSTASVTWRASARPARASGLPDPAPELVGRHDLQVAELCLRDQWLVDLGKGGRQVLHRLRAERTAERGEHGPRMTQRGLDIRPSRSATRLSPPPACLMASMISS
jgi:hypothetical protein